MRIKTGIPGLDDQMEGGFLENRTYLMSGPPGSGKTTFGVQFLAHGASRGDVGLYVSLMENPVNIVNDMSNYPFKIKELSQAKKLYFVDMGPVSYLELDGAPRFESENSVPTAFDIIKKLETIVKRVNVRRLVIDSIMTVRYGSEDPKLEKKEMTRFFRSLKDLGCTTLLLSEMTEPDNYTIEHFLAHGVLFMHNFLEMGEMIRAIQLIKLRGTQHDCSLHRLAFTPEGLEVTPEVLTFYKSRGG